MPTSVFYHRTAVSSICKALPPSITLLIMGRRRVTGILGTRKHTITAHTAAINRPQPDALQDMRVTGAGLPNNSSSRSGGAAPGSVLGREVRDCQIFWEVCPWQLSSSELHVVAILLNDVSRFSLSQLQRVVPPSCNQCPDLTLTMTFW